MNRLLRSMSVAGGAAALLFVAGAASAAKVSEAQARYQQERAVCINGTSNQDRATCLKEAAAALQEARREGLATSGDSTQKQNSLNRCNALPAQDREDCVVRIEQGKTSGSAQQGGILRESERPVAKP
ncbi:hypothetical protein [Ramlibacter sp. WS9]|uniref:hypothetical protein n=1 Tax=Ramlibacter sp. WS9 TaxID=1882741 RepID=UPI001144C3AB|nr:hypothetical protein [Ramlibacter sp. WS9]ROZ79365.1 hypothetical protein EEB15_00090 [Ramlibacter sp. WS9]